MQRPWPFPEVFYIWLCMLYNVPNLPNPNFSGKIGPISKDWTNLEAPEEKQ